MEQPANRRAVRRCPFVASVEVTDLSSGTRISAQTSELGVGGCFIKTLDPFPEGSLVQLRIFRDHGVFETKAKVVYSHSIQLGSGMGLAFQEMAANQRSLLEDWLAEIVTKLRPGSKARRTELGAMQLKTIVALLILGAACYAGVKVFVPYHANFQLEDKMRQQARFAHVDERSTEQLRDIIFAEAETHDIPLRREDIQIENSPSAVLITADYHVTLDLHVYQLSLHFHPTSGR